MAIINENETIYNEFRSKFITSSMLCEMKTFVYGNNNRESNPYLLKLGKAVHQMVLEGIKPEQSGRYHVEPEITSKAQPIASAVINDPLASKVLARGVGESVIRSTYCSVPCQIRMDWYSPEKWMIAELKTTEDMDYFNRDCEEYGYYNQLAFYRSVLAASLYCDPIEITCKMIVVEQKPSYTVDVYSVPLTTLSICQQENEDLIYKFLRRQNE